MKYHRRRIVPFQACSSTLGNAAYPRNNPRNIERVKLSVAGGAYESTKHLVVSDQNPGLFIEHFF